MKEQQTDELAYALESIAGAIRGTYEVDVGGSAFIGSAQALFEIAEAAKEFSFNFKRYVDIYEALNEGEY
jgi:hypothetical protein